MAAPKPEPEIAPPTLAELFEAAEAARAADRHHDADQLAGEAVELRRRQRDAALVQRETAHYADGHAIHTDEE